MLFAAADEEVLAIDVRTGTGTIILGDFGLNCTENFNCVSELMAVSSSGTVAVSAEGGSEGATSELTAVLWLISGDGASRTRYRTRTRGSVFLP